MTTIVKKNSYNAVLEKIQTSRLSQREQTEALGALELADRVADLVIAAKTGLEQLKAGFLLLRPGAAGVRPRRTPVLQNKRPASFAGSRPFACPGAECVVQRVSMPCAGRVSTAVKDGTAAFTVRRASHFRGRAADPSFRNVPLRRPPRTRPA